MTQKKVIDPDWEEEFKFARHNVRRAKKVTKPPSIQPGPGPYGSDFDLPFAPGGRSGAGAHAPVQRINNSIIGGDFTGEARGLNSLDLQVKRTNSDQVASGDDAVVVGSMSKASGDRSIAFGRDALATADDSMAFGDSAAAEGVSAITIAGAAAGDYSVAIGRGSLVEGYLAGVAIGHFAEVLADHEAVIAADHIFLQHSDSSRKEIIQANTPITGATLALAKVTGGGANGSITFDATGRITGYVAPT